MFVEWFFEKFIVFGAAKKLPIYIWSDLTMYGLSFFRNVSTVGNLESGILKIQLHHTISIFTEDTLPSVSDSMRFPQVVQCLHWRGIY